MSRQSGFTERIDNSSRNKDSRIILALDLLPNPDLKEVVKSLIVLLHRHICGIKINFHLILPLSLLDLSEINRLAHNYGLQSIADIKLTDIASTNGVALSYLFKMEFDAVIVNPLMGQSALDSAVKQAHLMGRGILALIYMSHCDAGKTFGIKVIQKSKAGDSFAVLLYENLLRSAYRCHVDGIIVGATQSKILNQIFKKKKTPVYSPGLGVQGGDFKKAAKNGTDYFIVGRSIILEKDPLNAIKKLRTQI